MKPLSQPYNHSDEYMREISPHVTAIWEKCKELGIPCVIAVCHRNDPDNDVLTCAKAVHLVGSAKTPPSFVAANIALRDGPVAVAEAVITGSLFAAYDGKVEKIGRAPVDSEGGHAD